jgi:hypothetical protein
MDSGDTRVAREVLQSTIRRCDRFDGRRRRYQYDRRLRPEEERSRQES